MRMPRIIGEYRNGTYDVAIFEDGTKERYSKDGVFQAAFAESMDVTISERCSVGCPFCYAGCTERGRRADIFSYKFLETLHPYTEMAIGGNDLENPQIEPFLKFLKEKKVIANMTVNQKDLMSHRELIERWLSEELIHGIGISLVNPDKELIGFVQSNPNAVIHTVCGIVTHEQMEKLADKGVKVLILGYKHKGRGDRYYTEHVSDIAERTKELDRELSEWEKRFEVIAFDNLALEQLNVREKMSPEKWNEIYMGDEGTSTFYIDLVNGTYAKSSLESSGFPILEDVDNMFANIQTQIR